MDDPVSEVSERLHAVAAVNERMRELLEAGVAVSSDAEGRLTTNNGRPAVVLSVTDDGVGIPEGGRRSGLRNLTDRARNPGGDAWFGPGESGGTRVFWTAVL